MIVVESDVGFPASLFPLERAIRTLVTLPFSSVSTATSTLPSTPRRPHTDQPSKILTHLLFLNEQWLSNWGGCLQILNSQEPDSIYQEILPLSNYSVVFIRADNSWHMVNPVTKEAPKYRLAAQVAFLRI
jgi:hypothetical protein